MPSLAGLPDKMALSVAPAPLPRNWQFIVSFRAGWNPPTRDGIVLDIGHPVQIFGLKQQDEPTPHGFNKLLMSILSRAKEQNLWGSTLPVTAVAMNGLSLVAKSNTVSLQLPTQPAYNFGSQLAFPSPGWTADDTPSAVFMEPGQGRRMYVREQPAPISSIPFGWYVDANTRLETSAALRGYDRFTFWLSVFDVCPRDARNVQDGAALAQRLKAAIASGVPTSGTLAAISAAITANPQPGRGLFWSNERVVVLNDGANEYGPSGLSKTPWSQWLLQEDQAAQWNYRKFNPTLLSNTYGVAGLG